MAPLFCYSTCPVWPQQNHPGIRNYFPSSNRISHARSLILSSHTRKKGVFVLSDLHMDYSDNIGWVRSLKSRSSEDVLLVAGDVAETYSNFVLTMFLLKDKFHRVFFVPENHDLWLRREKADHLGSLDKLDKLLDACQRLGVETKPGIVDGLEVIPLYSWYHESFVGERDITGVRIPSLELACKDFHVCRWPNERKNGETSLAMHFDSLNDKSWDIVKDLQKRCRHNFVLTLFQGKSCALKKECFPIQIFQKSLVPTILRTEEDVYMELRGVHRHVMCSVTPIFVGMLFLMVSGMCRRH